MILNNLMLFLALHTLFLGCLLVSFLVFDFVVFLRVILSGNNEKKQFIKVSTVKYELLGLLVYGVLPEILLISGLLYSGVIISENLSLSTVILIRSVIITWFVIINILALLAPLRELIGVTKAKSLRYTRIIGNKYILLWRKGSKIGIFYNGLAVAIKYFLWFLLINLLISMTFLFLNFLE